MQPFDRHCGIAAPLLQDNIDTDAIIPSREMNRVSKTGLGSALFAAWRYQAGAPGVRPEVKDFILNQPAYRAATILLGGANFGCGSSREYAVWGLVDFGIRSIIAPSFGAIFYSNCLSNGVLPVRLERAHIERIAAAAAQVEVNLELCEVIASCGRYPFEIDELDRSRLLAGLDDIDQTLRYRDDLDAYLARDAGLRPWARLN